MYEATGGERIVPIRPALPEADAGAPAPRLTANEHQVALAYWTARTEPSVALVIFEGADIYLGPPNDEAFDGHPLRAAGLERYEFAEVINSPWVAAMERMNRVHPDHKPERYSTLRHFVLPFHDSTFECIARAVCAVVTEAPNPAAALADVTLWGDDFEDSPER